MIQNKIVSLDGLTGPNYSIDVHLIYIKTNNSYHLIPNKIIFCLNLLILSNPTTD